MAPTMTTRNDGRRTATRRGRRTDGQTGRGDGRTGDQGGRGGDRGNGANGGIDEVPEFATVIAQQLQDLFPTIVAQEWVFIQAFVACKPKEFDGKGGAVAYIRWVERTEAVQEISGCEDNHKVKYSTGSLTGRALTWWSSEVKTRGRSRMAYLRKI
ncbi:hypothetical protein Tco_0472746 [Tanacetum coccineum]